MKTAKKFDGIQYSSVIKIADRVRELEKQGVKVIRLETGEPHVASPVEATKAAIEALQAAQTHYSHSRGLLELREAVCVEYNRRDGTQLTATQNILITPGGKQALLYVLMSIVEPGDEVIVPDPGWVSYEEIVKIVGGVPVHATMTAASNFEITVQSYVSRATPRTKAIIINSPCNPTGRAIAAAELEKLVRWCQENDIVLIADEIYDQLMFGGVSHVSVASRDTTLKKTVIVNGFSKTYAMTGWRLGYVLASPELINVMLKVQQNSITCPTTFTQYGALAALTSSGDFVKKTLKIYEENLNIVMKELEAIPDVRILQPEGGLYVFLDISKVFADSMKFIADFLEQKKVSVTPGIAFGPAGEGFVRISIATDADNLREFAKRLTSFISDAKIAELHK